MYIYIYILGQPWSLDPDYTSSLRKPSLSITPNILSLPHFEVFLVFGFFAFADLSSFHRLSDVPTALP